MSRHRHHTQSGSGTADCAAKLKAHRATLADRTGFAESDPRIEQGAWLLLAEDNLKEALLRGEAVPVEAMKPVTDMLASILPKSETSLNIRFVGVVDSCPKCGFEKEGAPEPAPPKANYSSPLPEAPAPQPAEPAAAAPPAPSANIVALRKDIHACR